MRADLEKALLEHELEKKFHIIKTIGALECSTDLSGLPEDTEVVFFSGVHSHERNIIMKYCVAKNIQTYVIPRIGDMLMQSAHPVHMMNLPILQVRAYAPAQEYLLIKRFFDIVLSLLMLILASPLMAVTAIAIRAYDGGPVLYRQQRLTKNGRVFEMLKFRSMRVDAEKDGVARLSSGQKDDRITPVGHVIRKIRIDELPQLWNILKGDMSIVGPRPERPEIAEQYYQTLPEFHLRLQAKAGLTGYAQVYGKYNMSPYDKLLMDLYYIGHPGMIEDLRIMFATVKILFISESTEGVEEGQTTAMGDENAGKKGLHI
jgi:exopolysaccharide biosynthesis polyprenyl glycosylphosphotransferase